MNFTPSIGPGMGLETKEEGSNNLLAGLGQSIMQAIVGFFFDLLEKMFMSFLTSRFF